MKKNHGNSVPTTTHLVTIMGSQLPRAVKINYHIHKLALFIHELCPCLNYWHYSNRTKSYWSQKRFALTAAIHTKGVCQIPYLKCPNCQGEHSADNKTSPIYEKEAPSKNSSETATFLSPKFVVSSVWQKDKRKNRMHRKLKIHRPLTIFLKWASKKFSSSSQIICINYFSCCCLKKLPNETPLLKKPHFFWKKKV